MRNIILCLLLLTGLSASAQSSQTLYTADNPNFQYTGRIDFSDKLKPKFWSQGVYIRAKFKGAGCHLLINDEVLYGNYHNYLEIVIDNDQPYRIQTTGKTNDIAIGGSLSDGPHTLTICKASEDGIGYMEFIGLKCEKLLAPPAKAKRKIEYIGDSITAGSAMDQSQVACGKGQWYDQDNGYMSYGAATSRLLNAQWQLTAVSGIGLIHSCCNMKITMPEVFDKTNLRFDSVAWNFSYQPDVVTICLGQNDGVQDSVKFCSAYVDFVGTVRKHYPQADIFLLSSPMADANLVAVLKKYLAGIADEVNKAGDKKVHVFYFSKRFNHGCGDHPDVNEHQQMAAELAKEIKYQEGW